MSDAQGIQLDAVVKYLFEKLMPYWGTLWKDIETSPELKKSLPAYLLNFQEVVFYFGNTHWAIEYIGADFKNEIASAIEFSITYYDYTKEDYLLDEIIGFKYDGDMRIPALGSQDNWFVPTLRADDILRENGWNYDAEFSANDMVWVVNSGGIFIPEKQFARFRNCFFYGTNDSGLAVRHIKWLDIFPLEIIDLDAETEKFVFSTWPDIERQAHIDVNYSIPIVSDFQYKKLGILNRFVEVFSRSDVNETDITRFLAQEEHQFILKIAFFAKSLHPEIKCHWVDEDREPIKPDFFLILPNGYADILEFKLPSLKSTATVGKQNRLTLSAEISSYVAQTRVYVEYFNDPRNRESVKTEHGINVHYPKRILVIGRRWMFSTDEWRSIENEFKGFSLLTYDDIVDGVKSQLYN